MHELAHDRADELGDLLGNRILFMLSLIMKLGLQLGDFAFELHDAIFLQVLDFCLERLHAVFGHDVLLQELNLLGDLRHRFRVESSDLLHQARQSLRCQGLHLGCKETRDRLRFRNRM